MRIKKFLMATLMMVSCSAMLIASTFEISAAQQRTRNTQRRPSRRVTNPVRGQVPPLTSTTESTDAEIISTADDDAANLPSRTRTTRNQTPPPAAQATGSRNVLPAPAATPAVDPDVLRAQLSNSLYQSEQRAQGYQQQLVEVQEKEGNIQARLEQIAVDIEPENIELANAGSGSGRPELARERLRRRLENERTRLNAQLQTLITSRTRLESVIATTDADIERLRARLNASEANLVPNTNTVPQNQVTPENAVTPAPRDAVPPQS